MFHHLRIILFQQFSGKQHTAGFPSDGSGSYHPPPDPEIILRFKILPHQPGHFFFPGDHTSAQIPFRLFCKDSCFVETAHLLDPPVPAVLRLIFMFHTLPVQHFIEITDFHTVREGLKAAFFLVVFLRQKHGCGIPVPYLQGVHISALCFILINIQKQLGGLPDPGNGIKGMFAPDDREISHRIQFKEIRTGYAEKISHHQICPPGRLQIRQTVKYIKRIPSFFCDHLMNRHRKWLKSFFRMKFPDFQTFHRLQKRRICGKPHINQIAPVPDSLFHIRHHKETIAFQIWYLPHDIVSQPNGIQCFIEPRNSG